LRQALNNGVIDAMLMDANDSDLVHYALPQTQTSQLDVKRAIPMYTVVFVRTADTIPSDTDPNAYFISHRLGMNNGATLAEQLRKQGAKVDDGAQDGARNLEKLVRGRVDGYAATIVSPAQMDPSSQRHLANSWCDWRDRYAFIISGSRSINATTRAIARR
jgi:hypothetical protein